MKPGEPLSEMLTFLRSVDKRRILVQCACGSAPKVVLRSNVAAGRTRSCGCRASRSTKHGLSSSGAYKSWRAKDRCAAWSDPRAFVRDLGPRPAGHALLNDGPVLFCGACEECVYLGVPRSARWAPANVVASASASLAGKVVQATAQRVSVRGAQLTVREAAAALGLHRNAVYYRLQHGIALAVGAEPQGGR